MYEEITQESGTETRDRAHGVGRDHRLLRVDSSPSTYPPTGGDSVKQRQRKHGKRAKQQRGRCRAFAGRTLRSVHAPAGHSNEGVVSMAFVRRSATIWAWVMFSAALFALLPVSVLAASSDGSGANVPWYITRATGITAYVLLFLSVALGLSIRTKALDRLVARWRVTDIHTFLSILVLLFIAVHGVALLGDTFIGFSLVQILVPFTSTYQPFWTGIGIIAGYLALAIVISFPARRVTGYRFWRSLHYLTFLVYLGALAHGMFSGTDSRLGWMQLLYEATAAAVIGLVLFRIISWRRSALVALAPRQLPQASLWSRAAGTSNARTQAATRGVARAAALPFVLLVQRKESIENRAITLAGVTVVFAAALFLAAGIGPFQWGQDDAGVAGATISASSNISGFQDTYNGTLRQSSFGRRTVLNFQLVASGQQTANLAMQVQTGSGRDNGSGISENNATLTDGQGTTLCTGQVIALDDSGFQVDCQGAGPYADRQLTLTGSFDGGVGNQIQGSLQAAVGSNRG